MSGQGFTATPNGTPVDQLTDGPGVSRIDPRDPAAPNYELLSRLRHPLSLREIMIQPVRNGYIGQDHPLDPKLLPPSGASLFPNVAVEQIYIPSPDGPIRCQVYRQEQERATAHQPFILYAHGGGFMVGRSEDTDFITRALCAENGAIVVSVNYRLAPEWPFPTGLDDFLAVYRFLHAEGATLGGNPGRVAIAGDSSGANFAAVTPLRAADQGLPRPNAVVLLGPVCDFRFEAYASFNRQAPTGIVYDAAFAGFMRGAYLRAEEWDHPHASPIRGDLRGYPPAILVAGTHDPIIDSVRAFARKLEEAGNPDVRLFVSEGLPHGFYFFPNVFPRQEHAAYAAIQEFLGKHLQGATGRERE